MAPDPDFVTIQEPRTPNPTDEVSEAPPISASQVLERLSNMSRPDEPRENLHLMASISVMVGRCIPPVRYGATTISLESLGAGRDRARMSRPAPTNPKDASHA